MAGAFFGCLVGSIIIGMCLWAHCQTISEKLSELIKVVKCSPSGLKFCTPLPEKDLNDSCSCGTVDS